MIRCPTPIKLFHAQVETKKQLRKSGPSILKITSFTFEGSQEREWYLRALRIMEQCRPSLADMKQEDLCKSFHSQMPLDGTGSQESFTSWRLGCVSQGRGCSDMPSSNTLTTSALNEPKPENLQWVFSESSNPHRPGQGATAACASTKYVPRGCWFRKLMPGHPRQNEEIGRNCFAHWGSKDFNPPCPTLLTQADQDLWDSQERKDLNITLPTTVLTSPQWDHIINEVGGLQTLQDPLRVSRVSMKLYFGRIFTFNLFI